MLTVCVVYSFTLNLNVSNFNVYLLGIVLKSKPFHCLWLQALGIKEPLVSFLPLGWTESLGP